MIQVEGYPDIVAVLKAQYLARMPTDMKTYTVYDYADDAQNAEARRILSKTK